jgi:2-oxoglutarate dehydrogenase E2 component (dihydrolipoamide succinyltransferase)
MREFTGPARWSGGGKRSVQASPTTPAASPEAEVTLEQTEDGPNATDAAKALAAENQIDLADVTGTGKDGRISKDDVANHLAEQQTPAVDAGVDLQQPLEPIPDEADTPPQPAEQA